MMGELTRVGGCHETLHSARLSRWRKTEMDAAVKGTEQRAAALAGECVCITMQRAPRTRGPRCTVLLSVAMWDVLSFEM